LNATARLRLGFLSTGIIVLVLVLLYLLSFTQIGFKLTHTNITELTVYLRSYGSFAIMISIFAILVHTFIPYSPFFLLLATNVLVFGFTTGLIINYLSSCFGAYLAFLFARYWGRKWVERKMERFPKIHDFNKRMESEGFFYVLLGRLVSFFPSSLLNYGGGISKIKMSDFVLATFVGKFPIIFIECIIAHDLQHWHQYRTRVLLLLGFFILLLILAIWLRKRNLKKHNRVRS
jgi:uncharacterized membrane protein YdjX (TVP38/TMEM64 family)